MIFKEPEVFEIEVLDEDSVMGKLVKGGDWHFQTQGQYDDFTASDLRQIADKLDELNNEGD